jgi:hypothetical protein
MFCEKRSVQTESAGAMKDYSEMDRFPVVSLAVSEIRPDSGEDI